MYRALVITVYHIFQFSWGEKNNKKSRGKWKILTSGDRQIAGQIWNFKNLSLDFYRNYWKACLFTKQTTLIQALKQFTKSKLEDLSLFFSGPSIFSTNVVQCDPFFAVGFTSKRCITASHQLLWTAYLWHSLALGSIRIMLEANASLHSQVFFFKLEGIPSLAFHWLRS